MNYIVFDLEFTVLRNSKHRADILEIGAIMLREEQGTPMMVDLFHTHVRPFHHKTITPQTTEFTGITQEQADHAPTFTEAVSLFKQWLGDTPYYLCSWGPDDKQQLVRQCRAQNIPLDWIANFNDIQRMFTQLQGSSLGQRIGLQQALTLTDIRFFGTHHSALDDAFNTAKLFKHVFPQLAFEQNNAASDPLYTSKIVYSDEDQEEPANPFSKLASLFNDAI